MRIIKQLLLSFFGLVLILILASFLIVTMVINDLTRTSLDNTKLSLDFLKNANIDLAEKILGDYGEQIVLLNAQNEALKISEFLKEVDYTDYDLLREWADLRELSTSTIYHNEEAAGYFDLFDASGEIVLHPNSQLEGRNYAEWADEYPEMWMLATRSFTQEVVTGYYVFIDQYGEERDRFVAIVRIPGTELRLCGVVNIDNYFLPVQKVIVEMGSELSKNAELAMAYNTENARLRSGRILLFVFIVISLMAALIVYSMARFLSFPITNLTEAVQSMSKGNLSSKVAVRGSFETKELAECFNELGSSLKEHIEKLKREIKTRQAVESELSIASKIQKSILPTTFPPFPERDEFDLYACMYPARVIGGDFYDFFFKDEDTLVLVIADVSGKGVPAALFMMVCRTLLSFLSRNCGCPSDVLKKANETICQSNEANMFVTAFVAFYNVNTGELTYSNGGHNPALVLSKNKIIHLTTADSTAVGFINRVNYKMSKYILKKNEKLVLFTDGVTDACDEQKNFFGEQKFFQILVDNSDKGSNSLINEIVSGINQHQKNNRYDDITILILNKLREDIC